MQNFNSIAKEERSICSSADSVDSQPHQRNVKTNIPKLNTEFLSRKSYQPSSTREAFSRGHLAEDSIFESPVKEACFSKTSGQFTARDNLKKPLISPREYVRITTNARKGNERIDNYNINAPFLKPLEQLRAVPFVKDKQKKDFWSTLTRESARWIGPNHYKPQDSRSGFEVDQKLIKFPLFKAKRKTVFEQISWEKKGIPAASFYSPRAQDKILGCPKQ